MLECSLFYGGSNHKPAADEWFEVCDPADGSLLGRSALAGESDVDMAVQAAHKVRNSWALTHAGDRAAILHRAADLVDERVDDFADQLEFGAVGINVSDTSELQAPFGGWKLSGVGRELGPEGLQTFLEPKHIKMRVEPLSC